MRILFLTQVLPYPLDAGPKTRAYYVLRHLTRQHQVTLLSFVRPSDSGEAVEHLRTFCHAVHTVPMRRSRVQDARHLLRSLLGETPFLIARDGSPAMAQRVCDLCATGAFDAVHADQLWMAPYAQLAQRSHRGRQPLLTVLDQHNAVFQIPRRLARAEGNPLKRAILGLEAGKLARYEAETCRQFDRVVWVTAEDAAALRAQTAGDARDAHANPAHACVIPICVDPDNQPVIPRQPSAHRVTFLGGLHWPPNAEGIIWFSREVWPSVRRAVPGAILTVIGKDPPAALAAYGDTSAGIEVTGYVPDPTPYLTETAVFIVPLHAGGGMRVKILDAWSWGLPSVSTTIGAEGICVRGGDNILIADTAADFAVAVGQVLREPGLGDHLSHAGRATVETEYHWRKVYQAWDGVYEEAIRQNSVEVRYAI